MRRQRVARCDWGQPMLLWVSLGVCCFLLAVALAGQNAAAAANAPLDWLLADRGPFHRAQEYTDFVERHRQGFTTRYKIYREFGRWRVNNLVLERRDLFKTPLPLAPEFVRNIRLLGRRPTVAQITENLIRKYGTHFLLSATLGGEESLSIFVDKQRLIRKPGGKNSSLVTLEALHQLAASYFIDRESTLRRLHHIQIATAAIKVTETRTGPLGCSNYDNLDSVSSVLVESPENKVQLLGLQVLLPTFLKERFVRAALSHIACNSQGELICRQRDCWCNCHADHPDCNCPESDIQTMEGSLLLIRNSWANQNKEFEESGQFLSFLRRLPTDRFLNTTSVSQFWDMDPNLTHRYEQLVTNLRQLLVKGQRTIRRLFTLCKRCRRQPHIQLPMERYVALVYPFLKQETVVMEETSGPQECMRQKATMAYTRSLSYWWIRVQSLLYCSEGGFQGTFLEYSRSCTCPYNQALCQGSIPCELGEGPLCASCDTEDISHCGTCNVGYVAVHGLCRPEVADAIESYLGLEADLPDLELKYLLQRRDSRILHANAIFISSDFRLGTWFDPSWRKRMLLTFKSNKYRPGLLHIILGISLQVCLTKNSTLEPVMAVYVNPFGGSHSESWFMPVGEGDYPDWERTRADPSSQCQNWTLTLGNRWKSFFETVHIYLRSRIKVEDETTNQTVYYEPLDLPDPSRNLGYMKINNLQVFGYSLPFDQQAIRDLTLQVEYPYSREPRDMVMLQLLELRDRVNNLSPPGPVHLDFFTCLLRHRLKLPINEVGRIQSSLRSFNTKLPNPVEYEIGKLCS